MLINLGLLAGGVAAVLLASTTQAQTPPYNLKRQSSGFEACPADGGNAAGPGWTPIGPATAILSSTTQRAGTGPHGGTFMCRFGDGASDFVGYSQGVETQAGRTYILSYWLAYASKTVRDDLSTCNIKVSLVSPDGQTTYYDASPSDAQRTSLINEGGRYMQISTPAFGGIPGPAQVKIVGYCSSQWWLIDDIALYDSMTPLPSVYNRAKARRHLHSGTVF